MNWNLFVTELVAGIVHGSVYALIALGYSMVYGILKLLNFAHGDVYMVGAFIGYGVLTRVRRPDRVLDPDRAAPVPDVRGVDARRRPARRRDRALRLPPPPRRPPNRAADHRARRVVLPRERDRAAARRRLPELRHLQLEGRRALVDRDRAPGRRPPRARADHRHRRDDRADDRAHAASSRARSSAGRCGRPRTTGRPPR